MLKCNSESKKHMVEFIIALPETCCHFPFNPESEDFSEYDDRIYLDGNITFDKMAAVVDYLRACNPDKK